MACVVLFVNVAMEHLVSLAAVLAFVSFCHTSAQQSVGTVVVDNGQIGIGLITGGSFGPGTFSIGGAPGGRPQTSVYVNKDDENGQHIIIQTHHKRLEENDQPPKSGGRSKGSAFASHGSIGIGNIQGGAFGGSSFNIGSNGNSESQGGALATAATTAPTGTATQGEMLATPGGNTQLYPVKPPTKHANSGQESNEGEVGSESGQILIGAVILNNNKHNKVNRKRNGNKQPELDAALLEAIFGSKGENNNFSSKENGYSNTSEQGSIQIDSITGGRFEKGTYSIDSNKKPATNAIQKGSAVNKGNVKNPYEGNEAQYSKGHGANHNFAGQDGIGSSHGQTKSGYNSGNSEEPWIWDR